MKVIDFQDGEDDKMLSRKKVLRPASIPIALRCYYLFVLGLLSITFGFALTSTGLYTNQLDTSSQKEEYQGWYTMLFNMSQNNIFLGGFISTLILNFINCLSRKTLLICASLLNVVSYILLYFFQDLLLIFFCKIFTGLSSGIVCTIVPNFLYTYSVEGHSGIISGIHSVCICIGLVIGHGLEGLAGHVGFNYVGIPVCIFFVINFFLLCFLKDVKSDDINNEDKGILKLIKDKRCRLPVLTAMIYHMGQHLSGVDFLIMSTKKFLDPSENYYIIVLTSLLIAIPLSILGSYLTDKVGRKPMMITSCFLLSLVTCLFGFKIFPLALMYCFVVSYNLGVAIVPWLIVSELLPQEYFKSGNTLAVLVNWLSGYLFNVMLSTLFEILGSHVWFIFTGLMIAVGLFSSFCTSETKGVLVRSLDSLKC